MNREIILANLAHRPVRTCVSMFAVAIEVALILVVVGLVTGITTENGERMAGVGADIMFQPLGAALFLGLNSSVMPVEIGDLIADMDGVESVAPVVTQFNMQDGFDVVYGLDPESFNSVSGGLQFISGRMFERPDEIVIDDLYSEAKELGVGDALFILNHDFVVSGVVENGKGARLYLDLETAQEMSGTVGNASLFFVRLTDPERVYEMQELIEAMFVDYQAHPMRDLVSLMMNTSVPALDAFLMVIVAIAVSIGTLVIFLSMYTSISERTHDIGIIRSLGASKRFVILLVLEETLWLCVIGVVVGLAGSFLIARLVQWIFPTLLIMIPGGWIIRVTALSILSGVLGAMYPSLKSASQDPVEALAYE